MAYVFNLRKELAQFIQYKELIGNTLTKTANTYPDISIEQQRLITIMEVVENQPEIQDSCFGYTQQCTYSELKNYYMNYDINQFMNSVLSQYNARTKANLQIWGMYEQADKLYQQRDVSQCLSKTRKIGIAINAMYVRKYFSSNRTEILAKMIKNIVNEFEIMLNETNWMDEKTRKSALTKLRMMRPYVVGYPQELHNNTLIDENYEGIHMTPKHYLTNILNLRRYLRKQKTIYVWKDWKFYAKNIMDTSAKYDNNNNRFILNAGILGGVFFGEDRPLYMDYGAIGSVVGHEITHGFDHVGIDRDEYGNEANWWHPETKKKFLEKVECVIDKYWDYTYEIGNQLFLVDGYQTLRENIADLGGTKEAYRAYQRLSTTFQEPEGTLPGLPYSTNQLLWLAGTNKACTTPPTRHPTLHSPKKYRINGAFSDMDEFSKDWNCPIGSKMNPVKKCQVW